MTEEIRRVPVDRSGWPAGPWDDEGDWEEWVDEHSGYPCLAHRSHLGMWCGYVGLPPEHRLHGHPYTELDTIAVHGGLTYAAECAPEAGICHQPAPGEPENLWWLGFDCGHHADLVPRMAAMHESYGLSTGGWEVYRDLSYCKAEIMQLAAQLQAEAGKKHLGILGALRRRG